MNTITIIEIELEKLVPSQLSNLQLQIKIVNENTIPNVHTKILILP